MLLKAMLVNVFLAGACVLGVTGCQTLDVKPLPPGANPSDEISKLKTSQDAAHHRQVNVLSPTYWDESQEALEDAKQSRTDGDSPETTLKYVATGKAALARAEEVAKVSRTVLGDVIQARQDALTGESRKHAAKDMDAVDDDLRVVTKKIEKNDTGDAVEERGELVSRYREVELKAIKEAKLGVAGQKIAKAEEEDAKELVPKTLARTIASFKAADKMISQNRHDTAGIQKLSDVANADADRLLKFTRDAKALGGRSPETVLIQKEAAETQLAAEKAKLGESEADSAAKAKALSENQAAIAALQGSNATLAAQKEFDERFTKAQAAFDPDEAEVFKQGDALVVRLKGLEFPSGKATMRPESYALMSKVKQVIQSFGPSHVVVAGHTDAVGSADSNKKLSEGRAESVKQYLVANDAVMAENAETVGFGYDKPLASNKSEEGRAQNRRVDITIEPIDAQLSR